MIKSFLENYFKQKKTANYIIDRNSKYGRPDPSFEFDNAMDFVRQTLTYEKDKNDQIIILDYILAVVREDLKTDLLTTILYNEESFSKTINSPLPYNYYDEHGNILDTIPKEDNRKKTKVDLSKDCVLVLSWDRDRLRNSIKNIYKNEFEYHGSNHLSYYFSHIDVCYTYNGTHSISSGIGHKKGFIEAVYCDVSKVFEHLYTDGVSWYNSHNNDRLTDLFDFRIGIIYEIAKLKYKMIEKLES